MAKRVLLWLLGGFYILAGVLHFAIPDFFLQIMPPYLPWHLELVYLSGVIELALGIAALVPATRAWAGWGIVALLIAVFPANIYAATAQIPGAGGYGRLPFQALLIAWAWWATRPDPPARQTS